MYPEKSTIHSYLHASLAESSFVFAQEADSNLFQTKGNSLFSENCHNRDFFFFFFLFLNRKKNWVSIFFG
jgi:hypothetical protein